jgi:signal peptidase II
MTGLVLAVLLVTLLRSRWSLWRSLGLALFIAGGVSNWVDRVVSGSVVDFMNVGVGWLRTGIFNFADVAIMLGILFSYSPSSRVAARRAKRWSEREIHRRPQ